MANRFLNNITINDAYTFPSTDGSDGQAIITDGAGNLSFGSVAAASADSAESTHLQVKNTSGSLIAKGTPVYITGNVGNTDKLEIAPADASSASTMPAVGLLETDLANNGEGFVVQGGFLKDLVTATIDGTSTSSNDTVYVKSGGGLTMTKPTGASNFIQNIAKVARVHASNGSLVVSSILRANDVPNLSTGKIWVGDGNTTESTVVHLDETNNRLGINETTPAVTLDISGTDAVQMPAGTTAQRPTAQAGMFRYNTTDGKFEGYTTEWGEIGGSGGGGGDTGTVTIEKNIYTGDGSDTTFDTTSTIVDEKNVQIYIDGVYQSKDNYTTSGSTVTFSTAPLDGSSIELIHIVAVTGQTSLDKFTGDGSTTAFNLSQTIDSENNVQIYIDGVYQSKDNYSTSGKTLTFTTAPSNNVAIEAVHIKAVDLSAMNSDQFTGDGSTTAFSLTNTPSSEDKTLVFVQGVYQEKSTYSVSGNTLTFTTAPPDGYTIEVTVYSKITIVDNTVNIERFTGDGSDTDFVLTSAPSSANNLDVYISGLYQEKNTYTFSGSTITLDEAPVDGAVIECRSIANISNVVAADNDFHKFQWITTVKTAAFPAVSNRGYFVNTTSAAITVTLPSSPTAGDEVSIVDYAGTADTNNITITSSDNINGSSNDVLIDYERGGVSIVYVDATQGWIAYNAANETATALNTIPLTVDYLVVAGGGGGGRQIAGGGGAGGLRTSYTNSSSLNGHTESTITLSTATNYTVTVGAGGAGGSDLSSNRPGTSGINSVFSTITSTAGGGGGGGNGGNGASGGSGGGGSYGSGSGGVAVTSPATQGYSGGNGTSTSTGIQAGGGGASAAGQNGGSTDGGDGGAGLAVNIISTTNAGTASIGEVSGSDVYFSGGGGGSGRSGSHTTAGAGGIGGGSDGTYTDAAPSNADSNTGGGGGASGYNDSTTVSSNGANGGSGVVILRYPSAYTITVGSGIIEASGSPFTEGSNKVSVFTGGTGNISFT